MTTFDERAATSGFVPLSNAHLQRITAGTVQTPATLRDRSEAASANELATAIAATDPSIAAEQDEQVRRTGAATVSRLNAQGDRALRRAVEDMDSDVARRRILDLCRNLAWGDHTLPSMRVPIGPCRIAGEHVAADPSINVKAGFECQEIRMPRPWCEETLTRVANELMRHGIVPVVVERVLAALNAQFDVYDFVSYADRTQIEEVVHERHVTPDRDDG